MRYTNKFYIIILLCIIHAFPVGAGAKSAVGEYPAAASALVVNVTDEHADSTRLREVRIHFGVNRIVTDRGYMDNDRAFGQLDSIFTRHPANDIAYIVITGSASPEGAPRNNERLAEQRTLFLKNYILSNYPDLREDQLISIPRGENWDELETMVENDGNVPDRDLLLRILRSNLPREEQKKRMMSMGGGQTYKYLRKHILPRLRGGVSGVIYFREKTKTVEVVDTVELVRVDTVYQERIVYLSRKDLRKSRGKKPFYIAVKTNLLYDAALLPNLSVEIPFGRGYKWSAAVEGNWSWWDTGANKYNYHRIQMAGVEVRRWFLNRSGNPLNGLYAGVYGYVGDYDVRLFAGKNSDIGMQSLRSYSAGLTAGYAMPVARRLNLEFGLGVGYFGGIYKKYDVSDCADGVFPVLGTYRRNYFGLTKAGVSLVWQIGGGVNTNNRKGVARW